MKKVLVAYDGTPSARVALDEALKLARENESLELIFIYVLKMHASATTTVGFPREYIEDAKAAERELKGIGDSLPNPVSVLIAKGSSPADLIVSAAIDNGCDLILMGSRGHGGIGGYLGSVSYAVAKAAPMNVMIAKGQAR